MKEVLCGGENTANLVVEIEGATIICPVTGWKLKRLDDNKKDSSSKVAAETLRHPSSNFILFFATKNMTGQTIRFLVERRWITAVKFEVSKNAFCNQMACVFFTEVPHSLSPTVLVEEGHEWFSILISVISVKTEDSKNIFAVDMIEEHARILQRKKEVCEKVPKWGDSIQEQLDFLAKLKERLVDHD